MNTSIALLAIPVALSVGYLAGRTAAPLAALEVTPITQDWEQEPTPAQAALLNPGDHHKLLEVFVGSWDATVAMSMPGMDEPMMATGTMEGRMVMDGRFLEQRFVADMGGMAFEGVSVMGYNGAEKVFESAWYDNSTTDLVVSSGFAAADGLNFTMLSEETDMWSMQRREVEERTRIVSRDEVVYERWVPGADGELNKNLSVTYKRKAGGAAAR